MNAIESIVGIRLRTHDPIGASLKGSTITMVIYLPQYDKVCHRPNYKEGRWIVIDS